MTAVRKASIVIAIAAVSQFAKAEIVSWTWGCDDADAYSTYISGAKTSNAILGTGTGTSDMTFSAVEGGSESAKSGNIFVKGVCTTASNSSFWSTVEIPALIDPLTCDSYTFEFDWAPSIGKYNNQTTTSFGLAVNDAAGNALFTIYANGTEETIDETKAKYFRIYRGADSADVIYGPVQTSGLVKNSWSNDPADNSEWFHITLVGSSSGVTLTVSYNSTEILPATSIASELAVPGKVGIRTGCYAGGPMWFCLDDFAFSAKKGYEVAWECTFENDGDDAVLTNGFVASSVFGTAASTNETANWTVVEGAASPKAGEKFAYISATGSHASGLVVNMPSAAHKARKYILEFDAMTEYSYREQETNGVAIVGKSGILATLAIATPASGTLYKGDSTDEADVLASGIDLSAYGRHPEEKENIWHHYVVSGDPDTGVTLTVRRIDTGAAVVENVSLGEYDKVAQIALLANVNSSRTIYAAIDNVRVYKYVTNGFSIRFK